MTGIDISVVVRAYEDTVALNATLTSVRRAIRHAEAEGRTVEGILVVSAPTAHMNRWVAEYLPEGWTSIEAPTSSTGAARQAGIAATSGTCVGLVDEGDMWSATWLADAFTAARTSRQPTVWRPEIVLMVGSDYFDHRFYWTQFQSDTSVPSFDIRDLLAVEAYSSSFFAPRLLLDRVPFPLEDPARGWGCVDWWWTCNIAGAGYHHRTLPHSFHYRLVGLDGKPVARRPDIGSYRVGPTTLPQALSRARDAAAAGAQKRPSTSLDLLVDIRETATTHGFHALAALGLVADRLGPTPLHVLSTRSGDELSALEAFSFDHGVEVVVHSFEEIARLRVDAFFTVMEDANTIVAERELFDRTRRPLVGLLFQPTDKPIQWVELVDGHDTTAMARRLATLIASEQTPAPFTHLTP